MSDLSMPLGIDFLFDSYSQILSLFVGSLFVITNDLSEFVELVLDFF